MLVRNGHSGALGFYSKDPAVFGQRTDTMTESKEDLFEIVGDPAPVALRTGQGQQAKFWESQGSHLLALGGVTGPEGVGTVLNANPRASVS